MEQLVKLTFLTVVILVLTACAKNTVYLHTYKIDESEVIKIASDLELQEFEVILSDRPPPITNMGNFVIYPRPYGDNDALTQVLNVIGEHGYFVNLIAQNRVKNHYYDKKTNIGLYLISSNVSRLSENENQELGYAVDITDVIFSTVDCSFVYVLEFNTDGKAQLSKRVIGKTETADYDWSMEDQIVTLVNPSDTVEFVIEREYEKSGNQNAFVQILYAKESDQKPLNEPFSCRFESRTPLID